MTDYTCAACGGEFTAGRTLEEAQAEAEFLWGKGYLEEAGAVVICEDCWQLNFQSMLAERLRMKGELKN